MTVVFCNYKRRLIKFLIVFRYAELGFLAGRAVQKVRAETLKAVSEKVFSRVKN